MAAERALLVALLVQAVGALSLTKDSWLESTAGKILFINYHSADCAECEKLQPAWEALTKYYADHSSFLVAQVDCSSEGGKPLCQAAGVSSFPTIRHGDLDKLWDYNGTTSEQALMDFAKEELLTICSAVNWTHCTGPERKSLEMWMDMKTADLDALVKKPESKSAAHFRLMQSCLHHRRMMDGAKLHDEL